MTAGRMPPDRSQGNVGRLGKPDGATVQARKAIRQAWYLTSLPTETVLRAENLPSL
jgi:hypothetical protein